MSKKWVALVCVLAACGGNEETTGTESTETETTENTAETTAENTAAPETPPEPAGPCPAATSLTLSGLDRSPYLEGAGATIAVSTGFADVTLNSSTSLVFATYTIEADPQFGLSAPTGVPDVPEGGMIFQLSLDPSGDLAAGVFNEDGEGAAGRVSHESMYRGDHRINPLADHTVTITEVTDEHVCGEIAPEEGASWPGVSGTFKLDRV